MLKEFFESVKGFCTDQARVHPSQLPFSRSKRVKTYWDPSKETVEEITLEREDTRHRLLSIDSIVDFVKAHEVDTVTNIWIGANLITIEVEENDSTDNVSMTLQYSPLFGKLLDLSKKSSIPQSDAIRLLRQQFSMFDVGAKALTAVRALKLSQTNSVESEESHISSRLGKSIMQNAAGAGELPEYIDVISQVYLRGGKVGYPVRVWLSIDFRQVGNILFEPDATQLEEAMIAERLEILAHLNESLEVQEVKIYEGEYCVVAS